MIDDAIDIFDIAIKAIKKSGKVIESLGNNVDNKIPYYNNQNNTARYYSKKKNTPKVKENEEKVEEEKVVEKEVQKTENPQGVIDSIAEELTTVRLQQAIILSEIVGKPRSKTRRNRTRRY